MQILVTKALAAGFAASMAVGGHTTAQMPNATASPAVSYPQEVQIVLSEGQTPLDLWLEKLVLLESGNRDNVKVLDNNGRHSFGCLQFQMGTFKQYGFKYGLLAPGDDAKKLIYDCEFQKEIAKMMILENQENWRHWFTSVVIKGLGIPPKESKILFSLK